MNYFNKYSKWTSKSLVIDILNKSLFDYLSPSNITYFWSYGSLAGLFLVIQLVTGIFLAMHYNSNISLAFESINHIMNEVNFGWFIRYCHVAGASLFFFVVYFHTGRNIYYGSFVYPRQFLWIVGVVIFLCMIATSFLGYVLPWGQMSFWAATVITSLATSIPYIGLDIAKILWGGFSVDGATLSRFFSLHYLLPFIIVMLVIIHLVGLHEHSSSNPIGIPIVTDRIFFTPYFAIKDVLGILVVLLFYIIVIFYLPLSYIEHYDNSNIANPLVTPEHIVPEWYFLPLYTVLRSIPNKLLGTILLAFVIIGLIILPFLNIINNLNSGFTRPFYRFLCFLFFINYIILGILGAQAVVSPFVILGRICTVVFFSFFIIIFFIGLLEFSFSVIKNIKN